MKASILAGQSSFRFTKMFKSLPMVGKHFCASLNGLTLVCKLLCHFDLDADTLFFLSLLANDLFFVFILSCNQKTLEILDFVFICYFLFMALLF